MSDETNTHRRVIEKARAEIERLTRELAAARDDLRDCRTMLSAAEEELSRLSPPSAPAQARALDAERTQLEVDDD